MTAFCERADVRYALQKTSSKFGSNQLGDDIVDAAIEGVSQWFANQTDAYWYDSNKTASDLIDASAATTTGIIESVGASPHRQGSQLLRTRRGAGQPKYPNTRDGVFVRVRLPAYYVESIDALKVRDPGGGATDWVADNDYVEGRDEDYYVQVDASSGYGRSYLYLRASSIGARRSFTDLLTIDVTYGLDYQDTPWDDVKRGVAALAAAQLITDDNVIAQIPDQGQLIGVDTQVQQLIAIAMDEPGALAPYLGAAVA